MRLSKSLRGLKDFGISYLIFRCIYSNRLKHVCYIIFSLTQVRFIDLSYCFWSSFASRYLSTRHSTCQKNVKPLTQAVLNCKSWDSATAAGITSKVYILLTIL